MIRISRIVARGYPHHVTHRGVHSMAAAGHDDHVLLHYALTDSKKAPPAKAGGGSGKAHVVRLFDRLTAHHERKIACPVLDTGKDEA